MNILLELPEDIVHALMQKWGNLSDYTLELLAIEGYRSGALTPQQLHRMLSLKQRVDVEAFLKERGISAESKGEQFEKDLEILQRLRQK